MVKLNFRLNAIFLLFLLISGLFYANSSSAEGPKAAKAMLALQYFGDEVSRDLIISKAKIRALKSGNDENKVAVDAMEIFLVQSYLNKSGYNAGEPDGLIGGKTRSAISDYSRANGLEDDIFAVKAHMAGQALSLQAPLESDILPVEVETSLRSQFKDPSSVIFSSLTSRELKNGSVIYCGEANGKNSYGAYAGGQPFYISDVGIDYPHVDGIDGINIATSLCLFLQ